MIIAGLVRLGRDAEVRRTPDGNPVANLAMAFNYGKKTADGRPTQWVDAQLWGDRAERLAPYLLTGTKLDVVLEDPHIETYQGQNGPGHKLVARVMSIEFTGDAQQNSQQPRQSQRQPAQQQSRAPAPQQNQQGRNSYQDARNTAPAPQRAASGFDDMDSDVPY